MQNLYSHLNIPPSVSAKNSMMFGTGAPRQNSVSDHFSMNNYQDKLKNNVTKLPSMSFLQNASLFGTALGQTPQTTNVNNNLLQSPNKTSPF